MLLLLFRPAEVERDAPPLLEALTPGDELDDLSVAYLGSVVERAEPFRPIEPGEASPGTRRGASRRDGSRRRDGGRRTGRRKD
ncbi:MAG: hypothetical protein KJO11_16630 [Gemmatimonadetes bacterium]|nr:hypothetical protein [Gemmatimonadota bacterium]NNF37940.1 hypothetical protein [Gemmatimonadota bacterium]